MNIETLNVFMSGAITMGFAAIALFFFSFWRRSYIAMFGLFALAFSLFTSEQLVLTLMDKQDEFRPMIYLVRFAGFLVIIAGIIVQNRRSR